MSCLVVASRMTDDRWKLQAVLFLQSAGAYDVRVPACATDSVSSDVFTEPIIFCITIDWIGAVEWLIEGIYHTDQYSPTWNSGYPLTLPEVGCL